jgi:hypothetical protein
MRRRGVCAEQGIGQFGMTKAESATETPPLAVLDTKSPLMAVFIASSSELP